jgi:FkbM family methyltransferase
MSVQRLKDWLVSLGPRNSLVRWSLRAHAWRQGFRVRFRDQQIVISKGNAAILLNERDFILVPIMIENFDMFVSTIEGEAGQFGSTLDFSKPGPQQYKRWNVSLVFPGIPEDDSIDAYTHRFKPTEGMTVFDIGAHAGLTTYLLAKMVGESGHVYAFEPDELSRGYLEQNLARSGVSNVTVVPAAVGDRCGVSQFTMDGSMAAGLTDYVIYPDNGARKDVEVVTLQEFCRRIGKIPDYAKIDIEGAEVAAIEASLDFLRQNPIHFAFDSYHRMRDGSRTYQRLEPLFRSIGYNVESSAEFGETFTWATPAPALPGVVRQR